MSNLHLIQRTTHLKKATPRTETNRVSEELKPSDGLITGTKRLTVVLCPPVKVASADDIVKDKADEHPGHVIKGSRSRRVLHAAEHDWEIDVFEETYSKLLVQYPLENWCKDTGKEEIGEAIIEVTVRQ